MSSFVKINKLVKMYGDFYAVDNLSLEVEEGEIFGLLGPNGAGKSTTLNAISTLNNFDSGEITIGGHDITKNTTQVKAIIGMVPQEIAIYKHLNAYENVSFFASLYGLSGTQLENAVKEALAFVGLQDKQKMKPRQMSGGMQRRLNIACGIAHQPKLIIMDEPTVGVDAQSREHILNSIRILKERGATVIYTSHNMNEVEEICDHIAIIDHGKLVAQGTKQELVSMVTDMRSVIITTRFNYAEATGVPTIVSDNDEQLSPHLAKLCHDLGLLPGVLKASIAENEIRLKLSLHQENLTPILECISSYGLPILNIDSELPNLDMTFLSLTGHELR